MAMNGRAHSPRWFLVGGFILLLASLMLSCLRVEGSTIVVGLGVEPVPTPAFLIEELLLDESAFPEGWGQQGTPSYKQAPSVLGVERTGVTFINRVIAVHQVYRFSTAERAGSKYASEADSWFSPREGWGPWSVPAELPYQSPVADQFRFACYTEQQTGRQACQAVGQYEQYLVRFHTFMWPETMTFADLERILVAIDERMAFYLGTDMP
jgi:hypothetical protein